MTLPVTYTIEAREPGHDWSPLVRRIPHTSYFLSGLKPEGDYEFRIRAESQYGLSPPGPSTALPRQLGMLMKKNGTKFVLQLLY